MSYDAPAMDVSRAAEQDAIADSLLGEPSEQAQQGAHDPQTWTDPGQEILDELFEVPEKEARQDEIANSLLGEPEHRQQGQEAAAQQQGEPQSIEEGIAQLDQTIRQYQLNDPAEAREFATDLCEALGTDTYSSGVNPEAMGNVMAKVGLSALNALVSTGGDPSKLPAIPAESAKAFTYDFLKSFGVDPRTVDVDAQQLSNTVWYGALNFLATYQAMGGRVTDISRLNDPRAAEQFATNFLRAFGVQQPIDRASALKLSDAGGRYLLKLVARVGQIEPQTPTRRQATRGSGNRPRAQQSRQQPQRPKFSRFQTNRDPGSPFDDETMAYYTQQHGKL